MAHLFNEVITAITTFFSDIFGWFWDLVLSILNGLLSGLTEVLRTFFGMANLTIEIPSAMYNILGEIMHGVGYFIPIRALLPIPIFFVGFYIWKFIFAVFNLIASTIIRRVHIVG